MTAEQTPSVPKGFFFFFQTTVCPFGDKCHLTFIHLFYIQNYFVTDYDVMISYILLLLFKPCS